MLYSYFDPRRCSDLPCRWIPRKNTLFPQNGEKVDSLRGFATESRYDGMFFLRHLLVFGKTTAKTTVPCRKIAPTYKLTFPKILRVFDCLSATAKYPLETPLFRQKSLFLFLNHYNNLACVARGRLSAFERG